MNELRSRAEELRAGGYSYAMIHEKLGVAKSTMNYWFRDKVFTPNYEVVQRIKYGPLKSGAQRHNARVSEIAKMRAKGKQEIGTLSKRDLWMLGLGVYIGEGAKTIEAIRVANSDPAVIVTVIKWFKEVCGLSVDNIMIHLHVYPDTDAGAAIEYWQKLTGLPKDNFRKTQIDSRLNKKTARKGKLPYGTAHIRVVSRGDPNKGVKLYRRLNGWMAGALQQI